MCSHSHCHCHCSLRKQKCRQGHRGHKGHKGHRGHRGRTGPTGPTGATGPAGDNGCTGAIDEIGPTGPTGPTGSSTPTQVVQLSDSGTLFIIPVNSPIPFTFTDVGTATAASWGWDGLTTFSTLPGPALFLVSVKLTFSEGTGRAVIAWLVLNGAPLLYTILSSGDGNEVSSATWAVQTTMLSNTLSVVTPTGATIFDRTFMVMRLP